MVVALPVPQVVQVKLKGTHGTGIWNIVQHLQYSGTAPQVADLVTIAQSVATAYATNISPLAPASVVLTGMDLADLTSPSAAATSATNNTPGTRTGTALTANCCCVASWQINIRYRGGHPRTYWPVGVQADTTNNRLWATAFITSATNAFGAYRTALNAITAGGATYKMVIVSRHSNKQLRPQPLPFTVNGVAVHGRIDTQRDRLGRETP